MNKEFLSKDIMLLGTVLVLFSSLIAFLIFSYPKSLSANVDGHSFIGKGPIIPFIFASIK